MSESPQLYIAVYTDQDVTDELRKRDFVATSSREAGLSRATDNIQLEYAIEHKMALLTFNLKDFARLDKEYVLAKRSHHGIIVSTTQFSRRQFGELLRLTLNLLNTYDAEQITNRLVYLQDFNK